MRLSVATWNINSVRRRLAHVRRFLRRHQPDVLCLQETKVIDDAFPRRAFSELGYVHQAIRGQKGYHGVAILARVPLAGVHVLPWCAGEARHVAAEVAGGIELHNFYVPAGGDVPDPATNRKFADKLAFYRELRGWGVGLTDDRRRIVVGDLNVAPRENDVWSHRQLLSVVSHTPIEVEHYAAAVAAHDWHDAVRHFVPDDRKLYTWWSYRATDWRRADKGRRLDHVWLSPGLRPALRAMRIATETRGWQTPSDHVPVVVKLELD
ncbi:MAG: exodeoxyribonuclease III [Alphaproteobacteria bacterium]|nr:exodeoxyribonuclease III [Alphaproteobacteria bacterium]